MNRIVGLDKYETYLSVYNVLQISQKNELYCFHVSRKNDKTYFYCRASDKKRVLDCMDASFLYTSGLLGMLIRNLFNKFRLISYIIMISIWFSLSNTIFAFEVYGENDRLKKAIYNHLDMYWLTQTNKQEIKDSLLKEFKNKITWMELYEEGNFIKVRYALKHSIEKDKPKEKALIAKKDAMIAYFDCEDGYKVKNVNDVVHKGDILVDSTMPDSYNKPTVVDVKGRVMGYTWKKIELAVNENNLPDAIHYFSLLLEARNKIDISLEDGEYIEKENILQFGRNKGKIRLIILYTLYEDITS